MTGGYLLGLLDSKEFDTDETILAKPRDHLALFAYINLRIIIESPVRLKCVDRDDFFGSSEVIFCEDNLVSQKHDYYIFQTRHSHSLEDALGLKDVNKINPSLIKRYVKKPNKKLKRIANELQSGKNSLVDVLKEFYTFTREHIEGRSTAGKSLNRIIKDYKKYGYYYGNCKEASLLFSGFCDCLGLPSRRISGKHTPAEGGHMWAEVCVPYEDSHIWMPVDPAMGYFNGFSSEHIIHAYLPGDKRSTAKKISDLFKNQCPGLRVKVEHVY